MKHAAILVGCAVVLSSCSIQDRQGEAIDLFHRAKSNASGAVTEVQGLIQKGKTVTEGVSSIVSDAKRRFGQVESGVNMLMQGKELIEKGLDTK